MFQARYGFSKFSSVSLVGGHPVGMGIDVITPGAICCDINVEIFTLPVNETNIFYSNYPGGICCNIGVEMSTVLMN